MKMTNDNFDKNDKKQTICYGITACFYACFLSDIIWKDLEFFVPLHCRRKKAKFAA